MSTFVSGVAGALVKALVTSIVLGAVLVSIMHYMGVPVPSAHDLLGGISRLARRS
jgi:phosphate/sulfate permease